MEIFKIDKNNLFEIKSEPFLLEKDIQNLVEKNIYNLFRLEFIKSEFALGQFRIDTLCFDNENNNFVIIEYKKGSSYSVIDQGYSYLSLMLNNQADFVLEYNENKSKNIKKNEVDWSSSKVIFISQQFNEYQKNSINFRDLPFELWEIRKYKDSLISLQKINSNSDKSIKIIESKNDKIKEVNKTVKIYDEKFHLEKCTDKTKIFWEHLKERLMNFSETEFIHRKDYINFSKNNNSVCAIFFKKNTLDLRILRGEKRPNGSLSKNFFHLDDPKKVTTELSRKYSYGTGEFYYLKMNSLDDLDYIEILLKQKYNHV